MKQTAQDKKNLIFYPLGTIGRDMIYALVSSYLLTYILFTRNLSQAQLWAVTAIMVFARVFDALNDPIMGNIIESTRTKWGKFKPWLLAGCVSTGGVIIVTFNSKLQGWPFIVLFGCMYILYSITYTMSDISYWGMVPALSSNADMRNNLTSRATFFAGVGGTAVGILLPMFTAGSMTIGGNAQTAYGVISIIIAVLTPLFALFTLFGVKETRDASLEPRTKVSFKKIISTITGNDQLMWIALIFLIQQVGNGLITGGLGATYLYFEFGYEGSNYSLFQTVGMMATAVLMITYPMISRKIRRKKFMGMMMIASAVGYTLMLISGLFFPEGIKFWGLTIGFMLGNFGNYSYYLIMMISIMNTVEYNELNKGTRDEGIITSLRPFITKMGSALFLLVTSGIYTVFGVTKFTNGISEFENAANAGTITDAEKTRKIAEVLSGVTSAETHGLLICMALIPLVLMFVSYILYLKKYKLDEDEFERICKAIEEKKSNK
jgi:melibiose permease/lactose/raffinose/galactose permease